MIPSTEYRQTAIRLPDKVPSGLHGFMHWIVGKAYSTPFFAEKLKRTAMEIHRRSEQYRTDSDEGLRVRLMDVREHFRRRGRDHQEHIPEAMALVAEASARVLGMRPYPVQIMGAMALLNGSLIEMQTGEGKTLVAALAAVVFGWSGRPCHVITVNDYLAGRDHALLEPLYTYCGLTVGCVLSEHDRDERRKRYSSAVVYVTAKELLADFLKDRLSLQGISDPSRRYIRSQKNSADQPVLNGLCSAVVDEADCVLVDDAATPLIISRAVKNKPLLDACLAAVSIASHLQRGVHYEVDDRFRQIRLTAAATEVLDRIASNLSPFWHAPSRREELLVMVLSAREFFRKGKDYVVDDGKVVIVDEFTGRLMPERKWRQGTHQIIELLEELEMTDPVEVAARLSFQRFFRFFETLSGMTGTVKGVASELWHIYGLPCVQVPTHRPSRRQTGQPRVFTEKEKKYSVLLDEIEKLHRQGRPVLVGTRTVRESEVIAGLLAGRQLPFQLLNAIHHKMEAAIVARAGEGGSITIATNMAGRGTDIMLGEGIRELGGLHVIVSEPNEAERIDRQFYGRCARQGDPGSVRAYVALDDILIQRFFPGTFLSGIIDKAVSRRIPGADALVVLMVKSAQMAAQNLAYQQRLSLLRKDDWIDKAMSFTGAGLKF